MNEISYSFWMMMSFFKLNTHIYGKFQFLVSVFVKIWKFSKLFKRINERLQKSAILNPATLKIKCQHPFHENNSTGRQRPESALRRSKKNHGNNYQTDSLENTQGSFLFKEEKLSTEHRTIEGDKQRPRNPQSDRNFFTGCIQFILQRQQVSTTTTVPDGMMRRIELWSI